MKFWKSKCERRGHHWFPNIGQREFTTTTDFCLRCDAKRTVLPWGMCLDGTHELSMHYDVEGNAVVVEGCPGPR